MILDIYASVDKQGNVTLLVNDKTVRLNETNNIKIDTDEFIISSDKNIYACDIELNQMISQDQKKELYNLFIESTRFGLNDVIQLLEIDRLIARNLLILAFKHHILRRIDSQWGVKQEKKEEVKQLVKKYEMEKMRKEEIPALFEIKTMANMEIIPASTVVKNKKK